MSDTLSVSTPEEIIRSVPYLLGFAPEESLVLIGLEGSLLRVTGRINQEDASAETILEVVNSLARQGVNKVIAIHYTEQHLAVASPLGAYALGMMLSGMVEVTDIMLVQGGRWKSLICTNAECCPPEGKPLPQEPTSFEAEAVLMGMAPESSREDLLMRIAPSTERVSLNEVLNEVRFLAEQPDDWRSIRFIGISSALTNGLTPNADEVVAGFGAALSDLQFRDKVWLALDNDQWESPFPVLSELCRRLPDEYAVEPLFLYAWHAWRKGDGAMANIALERALAINPTHTGGVMLRGVLAQGIEPSRIDRLVPPS